jgi:hypothetical protein
MGPMKSLAIELQPTEAAARLIDPVPQVKSTTVAPTSQISVMMFW